MEVERAPEIQERIEEIISTLELGHIIDARIICMRSRNATARAYARIWSLPSIWQKALEINPFYVIEVLSEKFDKIGYEEQTKVLIHELLHIPKKFSGGLVPHNNRGKAINYSNVSKLYDEYKRRKGVGGII
ncbi:MAG: putative metallopeptidase [Candidatus Micrarchaeia archaeon]|jgi:predicted metallopeptidase